MATLKQMRTRAPMIAAIVLAAIGGLQASAATVVAAGTSDSPALAALAPDTNPTPLDDMATPAAYAVGFLVGYIIADLVSHIDGKVAPDTLPTIKETAFDF